MFKKITCFILSIVIMLSCVPLSFGAVAAEDSVKAQLCELVRRFPAGKYWNHMGSDKNSPDTWTEKPCKSHSGCSWVEDACSCNSFDKAIQCMGYAYKIAYELVGVSAREFKKIKTLDASKLRVGDVIRYNGHSICVTGVKGKTISFTDCNYDKKCGIRWGQMKLSEIKKFSYVLHYEKNEMKNDDLDFYVGVEVPDRPIVVDKKETWKMGDSALNIRVSASTDASIVGTVPANAKFYVYEKKLTDKYLWGKIKFGVMSGWSVLNYSEYISGSYEKADILNPKEEYPLGNVLFEWSAVNGADEYQIRLYDKDKAIIQSYNTTQTRYEVPFDSEGSYYVKVYSFNRFCDSWKVDGELINFTVAADQEDSSDEDIPEISLPEAVTLRRGGSKKLTVTVTDGGAEAEGFTWHSDAASVATVTSDGEITANDYGKAKISCTSADGKTSAYCTVTVIPDNVSGFKQIPSKTTSQAIPLKWNKVEGITGYQVARYNGKTKKYDRIATTKKTAFTDETVKESKDYYYVVRAYAKTEQGYIYGKYEKIKCSSDPAKVQGLTQSASSSGTVTLKWNESKNADMYAVYKYNSKTKKYSKIKTTEKTSLKISQKAGSSVYYRVYAATKTEWGYVYSAVSSAVLATAGPEKVTAKLENVGTGKVKISWRKVSGATDYQIFRKTSDGYVKVATVKAKYGSFTNISLKSKKEYTYRVRAIIQKNNLTAYGSYSDKLTIKTK